jgi:hypothetical protein
MARFKVTTVHGESGSLFHVVDTAAPQDDQPAIVSTFTIKQEAEYVRDDTNKQDRIAKQRLQPVRFWSGGMLRESRPIR